MKATKLFREIPLLLLLLSHTNNKKLINTSDIYGGDPQFSKQDVKNMRELLKEAKDYEKNKQILNREEIEKNSVAAANAAVAKAAVAATPKATPKSKAVKKTPAKSAKKAVKKTPAKSAKKKKVAA